MKHTTNREREALVNELDMLTARVQKIRLDEKILSAQFRDTFLTDAERGVALEARWEAENESTR